MRLVTSLRGADSWNCVSSAKNWWFTEWLAIISERGVVYRSKRTGPSSEPWGTPNMSCDVDEDELLTEVNWYLFETYDWNHWSAVDWMPKTEFTRERRIWWSVVLKAAERSNTRRREMLSLSRTSRISFTIRNKTVSVLCPARQADWKGLLKLFSWKFVENDLFKDFGQKWELRYGAVVFQKIFVKWWHFQQGFDDGSLQIMWQEMCWRCSW